MTQPVPARHWEPAVSGFIRLIAVAAVIACLLAGFIIAFATLSPNSFKTWISVGIIAAGVFGGCLIIL